MNKRTFIKNTALLGLGSLAGLDALGQRSAVLPSVADGDDYWAGIRAGYTLPKDFVNLENGFYCVMPDAILSAYEQHIKDINLQGAYYMRTVKDSDKKMIAARLADTIGCDADELVVTRNTTESLDMIIAGQDWKQGDEAIMAAQDYGAMLDMFKQVSRRYGVVNKIIQVPPHPQSDEEVVSAYEAAITPRTRLLMVCHIINITGHILPVRKICDMAHRHGVEVMVDGAHAFAQIRFSLRELGCDYYGCSLHKWLSAPLGAGLLYVRRGLISKIWPIFADEGKAAGDIARLNHTGTHPPATDLAIADALDYYGQMGAARKEERLRYLQQYWTAQVRGTQGIRLYTPEQQQRACAIATVGIEGMKPTDMAAKLMERYGIFTVAIDNEAAGVHGCRITPNVYTTTAELDRLVAALKEMRG